MIKIAALICLGSVGHAAIICCNSVSPSVIHFMPEWLILGSFWPGAFFEFSISSLFADGSDFSVAGSSPVAPIFLQIWPFGKQVEWLSL
jgi:hypothetical protein